MLNLELHFLLLRCFYHSNRLIAQKTMELGLFPGQPKILECLIEQEGQTPKEIGKHCALDKSTVTSLLNKMEQRRLILRETQISDRRSVQIFLTEEGREKARKVKEICKEVDDLALKHIPPEKQTELLQLLNDVFTAFEEESHA